MSVAATPAASRPAGFLLRTVAYVIDGVIIGLVTNILGFGTMRPTGGGNYSFDVGGPGMLLAAAYLIAFWTVLGWTPGMKLFGMRVVVAGGAKPSIATAFIRFLGLILSFIVVFVGVIWVAFDANKQGWHDKIAGTYVIM